ncbi:CsgG/HfaB family protein [Lyngbya confervoides]|uniref:CsgG/HfaB family protein n=1 Tax=Lyngbya confervoides BDU141951 TaxID=1574623 RepID=A0ABD4T022_9CYAN|nr:CsgG/HfaB family protein [Lyngbya confervoides]MCM1981965.1 CsgG/HfaB family protein [Lyngbya confervoides BDU141951]
MSSKQKGLLAIALFSSVLIVSGSLPTFSAAQSLASDLGVEQIKVKGNRRIAVLDFDFASVSETGFALGLFENNGASKGISNLLTNKMVQDGTYVMIERSQVNKILAEQNFGQSGRVEPSTAVQIGRLLGVDAVIFGSITRFYVEEKKKGFSIGSIFGKGRKQETAAVQITTRLVSTATGEILGAFEGLGEVSSESAGESILGVTTTSESSSRDRLLGAAAEQAVDNVVKEIAALSPKLEALPAVLPTAGMLVADVTSSQLILNKGGEHGFRPGMILAVLRVVKEVKDPVTGQLLRR